MTLQLNCSQSKQTISSWMGWHTMKPYICSKCGYEFVCPWEQCPKCGGALRRMEQWPIVVWNVIRITKPGAIAVIVVWYWRRWNNEDNQERCNRVWVDFVHHWCNHILEVRRGDLMRTKYNTINVTTEVKQRINNYKTQGNYNTYNDVLSDILDEIDKLITSEAWKCGTIE